MSRKAFGGWGWELSDQEFGQALALLGVTARRASGTPGGAAAAFPLTQRRARALVDGEYQHAGPALVWDLEALGGLEGLRTLVRDQSAMALAAAWNRSLAGYSNLEIRPARGLDNRWLARTLQPALSDVPPHFALPEPVGRMRWNWPLRIGFAVGDGGLRDHIYEGPTPLSGSVAPLTVTEVGPSRCDILLLQAYRGRGLREIAALDLPEAALVIVFEGEGRL
jgi:hypothetical protein